MTQFYHVKISCLAKVCGVYHGACAFFLICRTKFRWVKARQKYNRKHLNPDMAIKQSRKSCLSGRDSRTLTSSRPTLDKELFTWKLSVSDRAVSVWEKCFYTENNYSPLSKWMRSSTTLSYCAVAVSRTCYKYTKIVVIMRKRKKEI